MTLELSQEFYFEAAHTLARAHETEASRRVHGHTYHAEVTMRGEIDAETGMIMDLAVLRKHIEAVRRDLDHHMLDDVTHLGPPTIESLAIFIGRKLAAVDARIYSVKVSRRASGDSCRFVIPGK